MSMGQAGAAVLAEPISNSRLAWKTAYVHSLPTGSTLSVLGGAHGVGADGAWIGFGELLQEVDFNGLLSKVSGGWFQQHSFNVIIVALLQFLQSIQLDLLIFH